MARSLVLSSSPSSFSAEIFGHKLRPVLQILAILGVTFAVEGHGALGGGRSWCAFSSISMFLISPPHQAGDLPKGSGLISPTYIFLSKTFFVLKGSPLELLVESP